jgi:hypothetical protein
VEGTAHTVWHKRHVTNDKHTDNTESEPCRTRHRGKITTYSPQTTHWPVTCPAVTHTNSAHVPASAKGYGLVCRFQTLASCKGGNGRVCRKRLEIEAESTCVCGGGGRFLRLVATASGVFEFPPGSQTVATGLRKELQGNRDGRAHACRKVPVDRAICATMP